MGKAIHRSDIVVRASRDLAVAFLENRNTSCRVQAILRDGGAFEVARGGTDTGKGVAMSCKQPGDWVGSGRFSRFLVLLCLCPERFLWPAEEETSRNSRRERQGERGGERRIACHAFGVGRSVSVHLLSLLSGCDSVLAWNVSDR